MHPNSAFRRVPESRSLDFVRARSFGALVVNAPDGPLVSHVPFLLSEDAASADLHLVRSNPILSATPCAAVIAVTGPDGYLSPDWYEVPDQVPTWNYVAVHLRGRLVRLPQEAMHEMLDRQSAGFETRLAGKTPWTTDKMTPEVLERMMRQIVPCRLEGIELQATWKLSQNKPDDVRLRAAEAVTGGVGSELAALAALMRGG
ncbi:FMN-binding negative transcriptional regulator [Jannaschia seohaensis]|uniref:Transcriptional regulator n=1 Tax=Jannaschia seohaensis TaxID=475081 RepID=A0A2Y9A0Y3_9RHOB|nr:FMN-binding negative transcriptional regulator [Jannaschia seohaensis]PWJ21667.1 transcriptional regulator [Jannaschia seohaensis]SSA37945.1 transcriptional regulator [Jannaschia seohaensis]